MKEIKRYQEDIKKIREGNQRSAIDAKLKAGGGLTPDKIEYLKKIILNVVVLLKTAIFLVFKN